MQRCAKRKITARCQTTQHNYPLRKTLIIRQTVAVRPLIVSVYMSRQLLVGRHFCSFDVVTYLVQYYYLIGKCNYVITCCCRSQISIQTTTKQMLKIFMNLLKERPDLCLFTVENCNSTDKWPTNPRIYDQRSLLSSKKFLTSKAPKVFGTSY